MCEKPEVSILVTATRVIKDTVSSKSKLVDLRKKILPIALINTVADVVSPLPNEGIVTVTVLPFCLECGITMGNPIVFVTKVSDLGELDNPCKTIGVNITHAFLEDIMPSVANAIESLLDISRRPKKDCSFVGWANLDIVH
ncbi:MAG: hypothetical protein ABIB98_00530 [bacterium]